MAKGLTLRERIPFVLECERDVTDEKTGVTTPFSENERTEFIIRHLNGVEMIECQNAARRDPNRISMAFNLALASCRFGLCGWSKYFAPNDDPLPYPGNSMSAVKLMDPSHILEVGTEIARMSLPSGYDVGKSDSGSSANEAGSVNSVSPATKKTPPSDDALAAVE